MRRPRLRHGDRDRGPTHVAVPRQGTFLLEKSIECRVCVTRSGPGRVATAVSLDEASSTAARGGRPCGEEINRQQLGEAPVRLNAKTTVSWSESTQAASQTSVHGDDRLEMENAPRPGHRCACGMSCTWALGRRQETSAVQFVRRCTPLHAVNSVACRRPTVTAGSARIIGRTAAARAHTLSCHSGHPRR
jgi:hypothetical protein